MADLKRSLKRDYKRVVHDILDNVDKYNKEEIKEIKTNLHNLVELNKKLDKYDTKKSFNEMIENLEVFLGDRLGKN